MFVRFKTAERSVIELWLGKLCDVQNTAVYYFITFVQNKQETVKQCIRDVAQPE